MFRTYKYLLRPTNEQSRCLDFLLWQSRMIYNAALEQRINIYKTTGEGINYNAQWVHFRDQRNENRDTIRKLNASSMQHMLRRLDKAFKGFYRRVKVGETPGFPRFKGRNRFKTIEYTYGDGCKLRQNKSGLKKFYIQNVGEIKICFHRPIPENAALKHVMVKKNNSRWYVFLVLQLPDSRLTHQFSGKRIGIDVGLRTLLACSNGEIIENPRWLAFNLSLLRRLQRHAARQKKDSHRRKKSYDRIAHLHEQITNQRRDYLHKVTTHLVSKYDFIAIEDMALAFMNRNKHISRSSYDASLGLFTQLLQYKAEEAGIEVVAVNPSQTSQICSGCGQLVHKCLSERVHSCPSCGLVLDRDVNAARNILSLALSKPPGRGGQAETWADTPSVA